MQATPRRPNVAAAHRLRRTQCPADSVMSCRRWTFYVLMIWAGAVLAMITFLVPETYHPVLLRRKAQQMRKATGDERWRAPIEKHERSIVRTVVWSCIRPFELLVLEPMVRFTFGAAISIVRHAC